MPTQFPKACSCGRRFTATEWKALPLLGHQVDEAEDLELRNCTCGTSLAIVVAVFTPCDRCGGGLLPGETNLCHSCSGYEAKVEADMDERKEDVPWGVGY